MFIDKAKIYIKAGNGGDGAVSFFRDKLTTNGGPDGGTGGKGGDVVFVVDKSANNLVHYYYDKHFRAKDGENGGKKNIYGKSADDLIVKVPKGTVIKDFETGKVIADMFYADQKQVILKGGIGGRGNAKFANSVRQAPRFSELGEKTEEKAVVLELKTIADVGLVGFPNVGKSTLLSVVSSAKPKIANYHFTTLVPNLGVAKYMEYNFLIADIPGLIEGAAEGVGLGHDFLRHIERTKMIVHVVDISGFEGRDPIEDFKIINKELEDYSKELAKAPQIVVLNKTDILQPDSTNVEDFKEAYGKDYKIITMSAVTTKGTKELLQEIAKVLPTIKAKEPIAIEEFNFDTRDKTSLNIKHLKMGDENIYDVSGGLINHLARSIVLTDMESFSYFQRRLKSDGIMDEIRKAGAEEGDTIRILGTEFELID